MDWLRRNWPDLAIGLALVAVIGGIVATLITGGTFFPPTPATPASTPGVTAPAVVPPPAVPTDLPDVPAADVPPASPGSVSVLAPDGTDVAVTPVVPPPPSVPVAPPTTPSPTPAPTPVAPPTPAATAAPVVPAPAAPAASLPSASPDELAPYRVSVGAFGNPDNATRQAQTFRAAGYPVFTGIQGNLTIVLVGPYDGEAEAQRVAAQIAAGGFGIEPVVYRYRPDANTPGASTPAPTAGAPTPAPTPAPAPAATPVAPAATPVAPATPAAPAAPITTSPTGRSLQVGAFADAGSAAPLRERLASLGLVAFEIREDGLIKLLVGPFDSASLPDVRRQLSAQGIESFPR